MAGKPVNEFEQAKKERDRARRKLYAQQREKQVKRRLGLTRHNQQVRIGGLAMFFTALPSIVSERWYHQERRDYSRGAPKGRSFYFAVLRYNLCSEDGRNWTALQAQCHDSNHGYMLNVTGFWNLTEAQNDK
jgi:hypothetical protein